MVDLLPHQIAELRQAADLSSFDSQQLLHTLLDAYEEKDETCSACDDASTHIVKLETALENIVRICNDESAPSRAWRLEQIEKLAGEAL